MHGYRMEKYQKEGSLCDWEKNRKKKKRQGEILLGTLCILAGERKIQLRTFT
jgi:hypothetical protein